MTGSVGFGIETLLTGEIVLQVLAGAFLQVAAETSLEQSVRWWQRRKARTDAARALVLQANHLDADQRLHLRNACLAHASVLGLNEQEALLLADAILGALTVAPARAVDGR